jgi:predicted RNase H-like nuclease (RuvC/YqgF family)
MLLEQFSESDHFFKSKETEFEKITNSKDEKLKELEKCLCTLSKEIENQNKKIKQNLNEHLIQEDQMKKYIFQIENQIEILNKKLNEKEKIIKFLEEKITVLIPTASYKNDYHNIANY